MVKMCVLIISFPHIVRCASSLLCMPTTSLASAAAVLLRHGHSLLFFFLLRWRVSGLGTIAIQPESRSVAHEFAAAREELPGRGYGW